jgi:hypothetical protein
MNAASRSLIAANGGIGGVWSNHQLEFLRDWYVKDSSIHEDRTPGRYNWNALTGIALMVGIGASFWTAVGLIATRWLWR